MRVRGFTLIELVVAIALSSIVVSFMAAFIVTPMNAYGSLTRRADLVDSADSALRLIARDLRIAVPNSVRVGGTGAISVIELLRGVDGARYRDGGPLTDPTRELDFSAPDGAFATTVPFSYISVPFTSSSHYLVIYNVGVPGANAYDLANVITPAGTSIAISAGAAANEQLITLSPAYRFAWGSPGKRLFLVDGPVTYLCDSGAHTLTRYSGYSISSVQPATAADLLAAGATAARVATDVGSCQFAYNAGTAQRSALATLALQLTRSGERVQLLQQVHLVNAP
jgi:MSHA biogenesis protein MshO